MALNGSDAPIGPFARLRSNQEIDPQQAFRIMGRTQSLHAEIGAPHPIVGGQGPMLTFENDPTGFEHIPVVARFQSFRYTLLYKEQRDAVLAVERSDAVEDQVGDGRSETHRGFVEEQQLRR